MGAYFVPPPRREQVRAAVLAALCSLLFLGAGVLPTRSVVPFPPELYQPALAESGRTADEVFTGNASMGDKYNQSLAWDRIMQDRLRSGEVPAWTRDIAGGAPFVPQMAQVYQPWNLLLLVVPSAGVYGIWFFLHQVLFGWLAYRFLRRIGVSDHAALLGMTCAVVGLWTQARIHHNVILSAALPLYGMLSQVHQLFRFQDGRAGTARTVGWLALGTGISWLGGFAPVSLQVSYLCVGYALLLAWQQRRVRPLVLCGAGMALGGLLSIAQMGPTLLAAAITSREAATAADLAASGLEPAHLSTLLWPDLLHWPAQALHQGLSGASWASLVLLPLAKARDFNYPETALGVGLPGLLMTAALLGSRAARGRAPVLVLGAGAVVLGLWLAMARWPMLELSALIPGARAGDLRRFLFSVAMGLSVLAALGADRIDAPGARRVPFALAAVIAAASLGLLVLHLRAGDDLLSFKQMYAGWMARPDEHPAIPPDVVLGAMEARPWEAAENRARLCVTFGRALLVSGASLLLLAFARRLLLPGLILLGVVELVHAGRGTIVPVERERVTTPPEALRPVLEATRAAGSGPRPRLQRLCGPDDPDPGWLSPPNLGAFFGVEDLCAYDPLPPRRMEELFLAIEPDVLGKIRVVYHGAGVGCFRDPRSLSHPLLDLLGVRFVLSGRDDVLAAGVVDRTPAATPRPFRLYERTTCLPRATFVDKSRTIADPDRRLAVLSDRARDPAREVLLEDEQAPVAVGDGVPDADVEVVLHADELVRIRVDAREPGYLRLADPYDPGWRVFVDGGARQLCIADHYLRAVFLEPGEHLVEFRYDGPEVFLPRLGSGLALLLVLSLLLAPALRRGRPIGPGAADGGEHRAGASGSPGT